MYTQHTVDRGQWADVVTFVPPRRTWEANHRHLGEALKLVNINGFVLQFYFHKNRPQK
jgi:hypothetical protein